MPHDVLRGMWILLLRQLKEACVCRANHQDGSERAMGAPSWITCLITSGDLLPGIWTRLLSQNTGRGGERVSAAGGICSDDLWPPWSTVQWLPWELLCSVGQGWLEELQELGCRLLPSVFRKPRKSTAWLYSHGNFPGGQSELFSFCLFSVSWGNLRTLRRN